MGHHFRVIGYEIEIREIILGREPQMHESVHVLIHIILAQIDEIGALTCDCLLHHRTPAD